MGCSGNSPLTTRASFSLVVGACPGHAHEDDEARAVSSAKEVLAALSLQGLEARAGVASGNAFCGLVGNAARAEYAVIG